MSAHSFCPGDILARPILGVNLLWHFGVMVGPDEVVHLDLRGVNVCTFAEFAAGQVVKLALFIKAIDRAAAIDRARSAIGTGSYRILDNNCEKFANWCATGEDNCGLQASLAKLLSEIVTGSSGHQHAEQARRRALATAELGAARRTTAQILAESKKRLDEQQREMEEVQRRIVERLETRSVERLAELQESRKRLEDLGRREPPL